MKKLSFLILSMVLGFSCKCQEWQSVAPVIDDFRTDHSFGFSINGIGYLVAGSKYDGERTANFYSYDPQSDTWTRKADFPGGARAFPIGHTYKNKAYFGFGSDANFEKLDDLWVYDADEDSWTELASCDCQGRTHPSMTIADDVLYITMGGGENGNLNDHWAYSLESNSWTRKADFPGDPRHHPFQFSIGDYIYAGFGHGDGFISNQWYKYDATDDLWEEMETLPSEGRVAGTQFDYNEKGYVLSGDGDDHNSMETGEFWEYDPEMNTWTELTPHPGLSRWAPASFIIDGWVYLIGGWSADVDGTGPGYPNTNWKYQLADESVSIKNIGVTEFAIYPNPTYGVLYIPLDVDDDTEVSVYNSRGEFVFSKYVNGNLIDVKELNIGMYYIQLVDRNGFMMRTKFVKK